MEETRAKYIQECVDEYRAYPDSYKAAINLARAIAADWWMCKGMCLALAEDLQSKWEYGIAGSVWIWSIVKGLRHYVKPSTPAFNDYLMAKWMFSGGVDLVWSMHHRAKHCSDLPSVVRASCEWMISSMAEQDEKFRLALDETQKACAICIPNFSDYIGRGPVVPPADPRGELA